MSEIRRCRWYFDDYVFFFLLIAIFYFCRWLTNWTDKQIIEMTNECHDIECDLVLDHPAKRRAVRLEEYKPNEIKRCVVKYSRALENFK